MVLKQIINPAMTAAAPESSFLDMFHCNGGAALWGISIKVICWLCFFFLFIACPHFS
jgi:hypothetical protein